MLEASVGVDLTLMTLYVDLTTLYLTGIPTLITSLRVRKPR